MSRTYRVDFTLEFKLYFISLCSIKTRSKKRDIFGKPLQHNFNPYVVWSPCLVLSQENAIFDEDG